MKEKITRRDIFRKWGVPERLIKMGWLPRYKHPIEKGILWFFFSLFIRKRDVEKYGTCISCGREITVETSDCGHFIPASSCGRDLLFDERNNNGECSRCNAFDELHLVGYSKGLDKRYGAVTSDGLLKRYYAYKNGEVVKDFSRKEYEERLERLIHKRDLQL